MSIQKVIATEDIKRGNLILVHQGLVRVVLDGIHTRPSGQAVTDVPKGALATFNNTTGELRYNPTRFRGMHGRR